jgi:hypothetical protein
VILFLAANPCDTGRLALDREARAIHVELKRSGYRDRFDFVTRWAAEPLDLLRELRELRPTIVHFSGHGAAPAGAPDRERGRDVVAAARYGDAPGGVLFDGVNDRGHVVCRGLLLALHRGGHIELPAPKYDGFAAWRRREPTTVTIDTTPIERSLAELGPVALRQVRRTDEEALVNALIAQHHYLGYRQPVGEHLK